MKNQNRFNGRKLQWAVICLIGITIVLTACSSPAEASTPSPVPAVETPIEPTPKPASFNELWESSPHADEEAEAFRHWDAANPQEIPATCAQCHSRTGFLDFLGVDGTAANVVDSPAKIGTTLTCYVCHNEVAYTLDSVTFPSGKAIRGLGPEARCITCHHGMASTSTVNIAITKAGLTGDDTPGAALAFVNSHSTSAATSFGSEVQGAYEYDGKTYHGRFTRGEEFFACTRCHDNHSLELKVETCVECHTFDGVDPKTIRVNTTDFDGNGDMVEGAYYEVEHVHAKLLAAIQAYARNVVGVPIVYDLKLYPYFFIDTNNNSLADPEEVKAANKYGSWTPRLLRAAYNYNYISHDKGAYAHNSTYALQVLYDSLADVGGDTSGMTRP
jgi:hypothetical protein